MNLEDKRYIVGIDLGTTNSAVSFVDLEARSKTPQIKSFQVSQLTGLGEVNYHPVLPSFLYIPGTFEITEESVTLPWKTDEVNFSGVFARDYGAKIPSRLVSSAKSWLCHNNVDRNAKILPWGSGRDVAKVSPVQATASYLKHIKKAWNFEQGDEDELYLENQFVTITVPASFDEVARDLTVEAARQAGLSNVTLLEEPLAAFYSWLIRYEKNWGDKVTPGDLILVCDVGGGTTDFTLITLRETEGTPRFERLAVGDHLILGGDNIDLALARRVESKIGKKNVSLKGDRWKTLCHLCREAKERILERGSESEKITMVGEGGSLIAGTISTVIDQKDIQEIVLDGFFPLVSPEQPQQTASRKGITEFGLPYEQEPAITRHMGWFLEHHREDILNILGKPPVPDFILFNGGSLKPGVIQERIREAVCSWFEKENAQLPAILENPSPELAVALGSSYYGLVKGGRGVRVGSGSPRSYYLGIGTHDDRSSGREAICIIERGLDEGSKIELPNQGFDVLANQYVSFDIYSSSYRSGDCVGDIISIDDTLTKLPPIQTVVEFGKKGEAVSIPVSIEAEYSELGTLALWCNSVDTDHRWQLQFQLRMSEPASDFIREDVVEESVITDVVNMIEGAFVSKKSTQDLISLNKTLIKTIGKPRDKWPLSLIRQMADKLIDLADTRKNSTDHETRWLNLTGFCMRPGFGDAFDEVRIKKIWKAYKQGTLYPKNPQARSEWWIMWRRLAGGLKPGQQRQVFQDLSPVIIPKKGVKSKLPAQEQLEIWMAVANMEQLLPKDKFAAGKQLLSLLNPKKCKNNQLWSLSRLGARELLYGSADRVIPSEKVSKWIVHIISQKWDDPVIAGDALVQMSRKTGDRTRDIDAETRNRVLDWLEKNNFSSDKMDLVRSVVPVQKKEENAIFGESLPAGLVLKP